MSVFAQVLQDNTPRYIEDFVSSEPDWANGESMSGDPSPDDDWSPAFKRAVFYHLTRRTGATSPLTRIHRKKILLGKTRNQYRLAEKLNVFGVWIEGLFPEVELNFYNGTDGIHVHYPTTGPGTGTSFALPAPFTGRGGQCVLKNFRVFGDGNGNVGGGTAGTRGLICQSTVNCERIEVWRFGWHGIHITASAAGRGEGDGADGNISNANGCIFDFCSAVSNGFNPGQHAYYESDANPDGYREWGCGMKMEGPDANVVGTYRCRFQSNAGWGMLDNGFLANSHNLNTYTLNGHEVTQYEADIINEVDGARTEAELRTWISLYGVTVGNDLTLGYAAKNPNNRGVQFVPYVELSNPVPVVDCDFPYFVVGGQGGRFTATTSRWLGRAEGPWRMDRKLDEVLGGGMDGDYDTMAFNEQSDEASLDSILLRMKGSESDYRLKYSHWVRDDPDTALGGGEAHPNRAGFFKMDRNNSNAQIVFLLTGDESRDNGVVGGAALEVGRFVRVREYISNYGANCRIQLYGTGDPVAGTHSPSDSAASLLAGSRFFRLDPVAGQPTEFVVVSENGTNVWRECGRPDPGHREVIDTQNQWETCILLSAPEANGIFTSNVQAIGIDSSGGAEFGHYKAQVLWTKATSVATVVSVDVDINSVPGTELQVQVVASGALVLVQFRSVNATPNGWCEGRGSTIGGA